MSKQFLEAVNRMKLLGLHENAIQDFVNEGKLNLSDNGFLFWLNESEQNIVDQWQQETGNLVYHVVKTRTTYGLMYSFFYVSKYEEEWFMDNADLQEGYAVCYVYNADDELSSEYGIIGFEMKFGGIVRVQ